MASTNPYHECIVRDPEASPAVTVLSYHRDVLDTVLERLVQGLESRSNECQATVLISSEPGMGKTHLLARVIEGLGGKGFPVFVPPIHETRGLSRSVLERLVSRLWRMGGSGSGQNQFEWLALQLFALTNAEHPEVARQWMEYPLTALDHVDSQAHFSQNHDVLVEALGTGLQRVVPEGLNEQSLHWAAAFLDILSSDSATESQAVDWIKGRLATYPGYASTAEETNLSTPEDEVVRAERRFFDLIRLFAVVRPIVLVFDQVENYASFGPESLRSLLVLVERVLAVSPATQVVLAANGADWRQIIGSAGLPASYADRFHPELKLQGLKFEQALELRDLRAGEALAGEARQRISDEAIREQLMVGQDGRARLRVSPRAFLKWCAVRWTGEVPASGAAQPAEPDFATELEKARSLAQREPFGFFADAIRTFFTEIFGAKAEVMGGYEMVRWEVWTLFIESSDHWSRWEAWTRRLHKTGVAPSKILALRPSAELGRKDRPAWHAVPGAGWRNAHPLRAMQREGLIIREVSIDEMLDIIAACRLLDGAADLGSDRAAAAAWFRRVHRERWAGWFRRSDEVLPGPDRKAEGSKEVEPPALVSADAPSGVVMLSVTRLVGMLTTPGQAMPVEPALRMREKGLIFHDLACRFVGHLLQHPDAEATAVERMTAFLEHERLWQGVKPHDLDEPRLGQALEHFARRMDAVKAEAALSWPELYIETELQMNQVLGIYDGVTVILSGRCDVLRRRRPGQLPEIVDYKLSGSSGHAVENQLQLALYAKLLSEGANPMSCDGALEIYSPGIKEVRFTHAELAAYFQKEIEPVLLQMVRERKSRSQPIREIRISTLPGEGLPFATGEKTPAVRRELTALSSTLPDAVEKAFDGFIGNGAAIERLKTALADACMQSTPPILSANLLLTGSGGLGKTELAKRVARALSLPFVEVPASRIGKVDDLLALVDAELEARGVPVAQVGTDSGLPLVGYPPLVIFIDEVHELGRRADRFLNLFEPKQRRAVGAEKVGDFAKATLLAATTDAGLLPKPFLTRFDSYALTPYTQAEVAEILRRSGCPGDEGFLESLAACARLNPRQAKLRAEEMMKYHRVHQVPMTEEGLEFMRERWQVDAQGLAARDFHYLEILREQTLGLQAVANRLSLEPTEVARDIEPYLLQLGLIEITPKGRALTALGRSLSRVSL
jgi:Holliday junction resolvasome RuvABC ATP-dependent DNA helicase subunit